MRVLAFDLWGDYGHFRKFYTTSSPLTFSFPSPSTIAGILGAIYGASKGQYLNVFGASICHLAIRIEKPIKKVRMGINHINTKGNYWIPYGNQYHEPRTQIRTEFLKDPCYRIYVSHEDDKTFDRLCNLVKDHECIYTLSLGLSELLADFRYVGLYNAEARIDGSQVTLDTPLTFSNLISPDEFVIEPGRKYFKEKMPLVMTQERVIEKYDDVIFEVQGQQIKASVRNYYSLENGENIAFF